MHITNINHSAYSENSTAGSASDALHGSVPFPDARSSAPVNRGRCYDLFVSAEVLGRVGRSARLDAARESQGFTGDSIRFQTERNRLTARKRRAHIDLLTFPQNRGLKKIFREARTAEAEFIRVHREDIRRERKAGNREDYVAPLAFTAPSLATLRVGKTMPKGLAEGFPFYRDCLIQMDDIVNKSATDWVNHPGRQTEKAYRHALNVRSVFEQRHEAAIKQEMRAGLWNVAAAETQEAKVAARPFQGNRVYELGVRTERLHDMGIPNPGDRAGSPIARYIEGNV